MTHRRDDDRGSVLVLVLVFIVIAGFIVIPMMRYTATVLRHNAVVGQQTKDTEAAKAGLRVAVSDPTNLFEECGAPTFGPPLQVNSRTVTTKCTIVDDITGWEAIGEDVPIGATAMQHGASVPADIGIQGTRNFVPPSYVTDPDDLDWWDADGTCVVPPPGPADPVDPSQWCKSPRGGKIFMPNLPVWPTIARTGPLPMPAGFNGDASSCQAFLPGDYSGTDLVLTGDTLYYFASGVYYFDRPITVSGDADVVVGYGLEDFSDRGSDCADDYQVAAQHGASTINGGGATWVFGGDASLTVDDAAGSPSVRFNMRYADADRGDRVSIMTVNGAGGVDHVVDYLNRVRASVVASPGAPIAPSTYVESSTALTDAARSPEAPVVTLTPLRTGPDTDDGAVLVSWDHLVGNAAGGSPIQGYVVTLSPDEGSGCDDIADLVVIGTSVSCLVTDLDLGTAYDVTVAGENLVGVGLVGTASDTPMAASDLVSEPAAVADVAADPTDQAGQALVSWTEPATGAPITEYHVVAERIARMTTPSAPVAFPAATTVLADVATQVVLVDTPVSVELPVSDADGDPLTVMLDSWPIELELLSQPSVAGTIVTVDVPAGTPVGPYAVDYTVDDGTDSVSSSLTIDVTDTDPGNVAPIANPMSVTATEGVAVGVRVAAYDPDGEDVLTVTVGLPADPAGWTITAPTTPGELVVNIETTAPNGVYTIPYTVADGVNPAVNGDIAVTVERSVTLADSCTVDSPPSNGPAGAALVLDWSALPTSCVVDGLAPLTDPDDLGYRFTVIATNAVGDSVPATQFVDAPTSFDGAGSAVPSLPSPTFDPYNPMPIINVLAGGSGDAYLRIPSYVAVPMGRVRVVTSTSDDMVRIIGGVMAGTFDLESTPAGMVEVGFKDDIVLQRQVRVVSTAGNATSTALVQINANGGATAINTWIID